MENVNRNRSAGTVTPNVPDTTLTAALVDDEELARSYLKELLGLRVWKC